MSDQQFVFETGYRIGELHHRVTAVEAKISSFEQVGKRVGIIIALSLLGAVLNSIPGIPAKLIASTVQLLQAAF